MSYHGDSLISICHTSDQKQCSGGKMSNIPPQVNEISYLLTGATTDSNAITQLHSSLALLCFYVCRADANGLTHARTNTHTHYINIYRDRFCRGKMSVSFILSAP